MDGLLNLECRPLRIEKLQDSNGNDLDLSYTVGDVFSDKASCSLESIVRVVQISAARDSSLPPESGLRPQILAGGAQPRNKRPAPEDLREVSHESDVSGARKYVKGGLPTPGRAKRPRTEDFLVLDSMDEAEVAGDANVRDWGDRNGLPRRSSSSEGEGEEGEEEDDNESFKDALMGEAPAHSGGRVSPSLGHHTPEAEPTLPDPTPVTARRSPSLRFTGVKVLPPGRRTEFSEVKEEISSSPFLNMSELAKRNSPPKVNRAPGTEVSTISGQNNHPSSSLRRRSHESPRSGTTRGSSAYRASESSDDDSSVAKGNKANSPRRRRSKSKSSTISETATSEADDESSQVQAARKLHKEQEEQERENLIREAEKQKQAEKEKRESQALANEIEAQAKREQQEAREREARQRASKETRERAAKAAEERDRIEKERLEKERLELERSKQEAAASAKSAAEETAREIAIKAETAQQNSSQKKASLPGPTTEATRSPAYELKLARRRESRARLKAEKEAAAKKLEEIERQKSLGEVGLEKEPALVEETKAAPEHPELPDTAAVGDNQEESKTGQKKPRVRSKSGKTMDELKAEREAKAKEKELEKKEKQERQKADREEKKRIQQEEKEHKAREKKEVQEKAKKVRLDQKLMEDLGAGVQGTQEKDSQGKESQSSSNESESHLPPILNSALKRKDSSTSAAKKPTHVSFADENPTSSVAPISSPTPIVKKTPILPPGYIPASQRPETSTAPEQVKPPAAVTTSMPPPTTNGTAQIPPKSKNVKQKEAKGTSSSGSQETAVVSQLKGGKAPQTKAAPVKKPEPKKPVQSKPETESDSGSGSGSETEIETASESDPESVDSVREATQATPTPGSKAVKAPLPGAQKPKSKPTPPSSAQATKPTTSKRKAKSAVTRYEESTDSSSEEEKEVTPPPSLPPPTSAQRPKPSPSSESDSETDTETDIESEDENAALPATNTPAPVVLIKHPPPASSHLSGNQRYKSLTDMEKDPIPDVRDVHQAARAATAAAGNKRSGGPNSSHARKRQELAEQEASDDSDGSSDDGSDDSEEESEAKKDALAGKRASVPKKSGFGFRLA